MIFSMEKGVSCVICYLAAVELPRPGSEQRLEPRENHRVGHKIEYTWAGTESETGFLKKMPYSLRGRLLYTSGHSESA